MERGVGAQRLADVAGDARFVEARELVARRGLVLGGEPLGGAA